MIVKFFKSNNNPKATIDYLIGKERDREEATVLQGNVDLSLNIAQSLTFANRYTAGCLSFEENDIPREDKQAIIDHFEKAVFSGLETEQYNILWIEHRDKGRLELNFFIPNVELTSQKRLQPYFDRADRPLIENLKQVINHEHGLSDPNAPEKRQSLISQADLPKNKKEALNAINEGIEGLIKSGNIKNRDDIIRALESSGIEIARITPKNISIKTEGQNLRLKGAFYEQDFRFSEDLSRDLTERAREYERSRPERYQTARERLDRAITARQQEFSRKYPNRAGEINQTYDKNISITDANSIHHSDNYRYRGILSSVEGEHQLPRNERVENISGALPNPIEQHKTNQLHDEGQFKTNVCTDRPQLQRNVMGRQLQDNTKELNHDSNNRAFRENIERIIATARKYSQSIIEKVGRIGTRERLNQETERANKQGINEIKSINKIFEVELNIKNKSTSKDKWIDMAF